MSSPVRVSAPEIQYTDKNVHWPPDAELVQDLGSVASAGGGHGDDDEDEPQDLRDDTRSRARDPLGSSSSVPDNDGAEIEEIEKRTRGKLSAADADRIFGAKAGSVESVMRENHKRALEIERREDYLSSAYRDSSIMSSSNPNAAPPSATVGGPVSVVRGSDGSVSSIVRPGEDGPTTDVSFLMDHDLLDPEQQHIHVNLVGHHIPPFNLDPGIRLCGAWSSVEDVHARVKHFNSIDQRPTHVCWPAHKFRLLASRPEHLENSSYRKKKQHAILALYHENRTTTTDKFLQKTRQQEQPPPSSSSSHRKSSNSRSSSRGPEEPPPSRIVTERTLERRAERRKHSSRAAMFKKRQRESLQDGKTSDVVFPETCRIYDQRFAAVIFIPDLIARSRHEDPEPLFMFLRAFSTQEACEAYAERIAQPHYSEYSVDVVDMYEWLWPTDIRSKDIKEQYRHGELAQIMERAKIEKNKVLSYEEWCKRKQVKQSPINIPVASPSS